jgi:hypothetical protein
VFKAYKRWRLNRKLRLLRGYLDRMENWEERKAALGLPTERPDWLPAGIAAAKAQIGSAERKLIALDRPPGT